MSPALFISMFAIGLATSVHCISMCGPMVVTYAVKTDGRSRWTSRVTANVAYQAAKLVSYLLVGLALGAVGTALDLDAVRPWVHARGRLFMVILGLGMTGKAPWAARLTPRPPRALINAISGLRRRATRTPSPARASLATPVSFGLLTGLMPCAPLMAAELAAASSGSVLGGGLTMVAFGLGTLPLLFAFGTASSLVPGTLEEAPDVRPRLCRHRHGPGVPQPGRHDPRLSGNRQAIEAAVLGTRAQEHRPPSRATPPATTVWSR